MQWTWWRSLIQNKMHTRYIYDAMHRAIYWSRTTLGCFMVVSSIHDGAESVKYISSHNCWPSSPSTSIFNPCDVAKPYECILVPDSYLSDDVSVLGDTGWTVSIPNHPGTIGLSKGHISIILNIFCSDWCQLKNWEALEVWMHQAFYLEVELNVICC